MRYAIYFTTSSNDAVTREAASWLGRDAFSDQPIAHPASNSLTPEMISEITSSPRKYGFHGTLKAPFRLAKGHDEAGLIAAFDQFVASTEAFTLPEMVVGNISGFFALVPPEPSSALNALAAEVVTAFEPFRAPLTATDIARRNPEHLSPAEAANLHDWGYPYVFESFRFHMTLTNRITVEERPAIEAELTRLFDRVLPRPFPIDGLAIYVEPEPGVPFTVLRHAALAPQQERKTA
jgi:putative phosphonate metabolism protein